jgi:ankyrin repeat protein
MRLLHTLELKVEEFVGNQVPRYAILSHTWKGREVTLQDMRTNQAIKLAGYDKVRKACSRAWDDGFEHLWIDTCCIDKTSSAELSEALNSMYRWYEEAEECYAYLADVRPGTADRLTGIAGDEFRNSRWFTRGWTLQELIAPSTVIFLDSEWEEIGSKSSLQQLISEITGIPGGFLFGDDLGYASVAQRMSWAAKRETTRIEDLAYCLMGIFDIYMPMLYGEGDRAFIRLQEEIMRVSDDHSLFAWRSTEDHGGILATSPSAFVNSGNIISTDSSNVISSPPTLSSRGIRLSLRLTNDDQQGLGLAILHCTVVGKENMRLAIHLRDVFLTKQDFVRVQSSTLELRDLGDINPSQYPLTDLYVRQWRSTRNRKWEDIEKCTIKLEGIGGEFDPRRTYLHSNWEWRDGLMVTTMELPPKGILGRLLVECRDGTLFQLVLTKSGRHLSAAVHNSFEADSKTDQGSIAPEQRQHERDRIVRVLDNGQHVHVAIKKRILMLGEKKCLMGVVEISYSSTLPAMRLECVAVAVLEGDFKENALRLYAVERGYEVVVKLLLHTMKIHIDARDTNGLTLLSLAAKMGHEAVVQLLLNRGAEKETKDSYGQTPLWRAAENGHKAVVQLLLSRGAEKDTKDNYGRTPLWLAARKGHKDVVQLLLDWGARETKDESGQTPLSWAAEMGNEAVVKLLLDKGAEKDTKDNYGQTPLWLAARKGHKDVVQLLLDWGAEKETKDNYGRTLLSWAAETGNEAVVKLLLDKGAEKETKDNYGQTPLSCTAGNGHKAVVQLLLDRGAEKETKDKNGQTPLSWAARNGHKAVVQLLLDRGVEKETKDKNGQAPLSWTARNGHKAVVQLLLNRGADKETKDKNGQTPLSRAAENRHEAVVQLLLDGVLKH